MSFYDDASLIMYPSGYKEDKIYSLKPTDGSGDLTFTRASTATRVNAEGLIETSPVNLLEYSEQFDNGVWSKYQSTVTANTTTAPNGTNNADYLIENFATDIHITFQIITISAGVATTSVYAKANTRNHIVLYSYDNVSQFYFSNVFNLSNGTTTGANQSIESVGNGWYRCIFTFTTTVSGPHYTYVALSDGTNINYAGDGTSGVYIWGAQLNIGSTAKPYFPTTDRLNVPRIDYTGGGCGSLLLEKQSTNLFSYSEQLQTGTGGTVTVTPNTAISPDGTQNADSLGAGYLTKSISQSAGTWTFSTFAKYLSSNTFGLYIYDGAYYTSTFNVSTGVVTSSSAGVTASIQNMGNGWYRCIMTATTANNVSEVGFGSGNVYAWGCQLE